jgi:two-component system, chemotaxis family, sensor kinase CheA
MQARLLAIFAVESEEHVQAMNRHLLALEGGAGDESRRSLLPELFREAHNLKGAARAVNLSEVEALAHDLEELFDRMRAGRLDPGRELLERAFRQLDSIEELVRAATGGSGEAAPPGTGSGGGAEPTPAPASRPPSTDDSVRVATAKLDVLMAEVGELLVVQLGAEQRLDDARSLEADLANWESDLRKARRHGGTAGTAGDATAFVEQSTARLRAARKALGELCQKLQADVRGRAQLTADLGADVRRLRMLPVATLFGALPRMVRDLARDRGKEVAVAVDDGGTEVDRSVLEQVKDPLVHLVRNCIDHGIEPPDVRAAAGKPAAGTVSLRARQRGDTLVIEVADDGSGIDPTRVRATAVERGLLATETAAELPDHDALGLILRSGLSTSPDVTELSGRGVGLDVVRENVERLHGSIQVASDVGDGTTMSLSLPLSVSTMHCLLLEAGGQTYALPVAGVERIVRVAADQIERAEGRQAVRIDGRPVVLASLAELLGLGSAATGDGHAAKRPVIVVAGQGRRVGLLVDRLERTQELVVKNLPEPLLRVRHLAGATILGSGRVAMILSATDLVASVERAGGTTHAAGATAEVPPATILVAEDSITTRTLEKSILEGAGYRVTVAGDGAEAWRLLQANRCDLLLTDVEMPEMDGFELTSKVRADQRLRDLPVVLVTARDSDEDLERGITAGADAYVVKGAFDQERLLDTLRRLL